MIPRKPPPRDTAPANTGLSGPQTARLPPANGAATGGAPTLGAASSAPHSARGPSDADHATLTMPPVVSASSNALGALPVAINTLTCLSAFEAQEIASYERCCYYAGQLCRTKIEAPAEGANYGYDDDKGDYLIQLHDHISYRYEVIGLLGRGSFGQVVKCTDHKEGKQIALKIIRNKKRFHQQAQVEIKVLTHLRDRDPDAKYGIIRLLDTFVFRSHVCLTYELLSINLYEYMKLNRFHPLPLNVVKKIGASILISLAFMWRENIVHCDLKPENILLRHPNRTGVKVIDLGSACFETERLYTYIQSRFYRAPEVILHLNYSKKIDLWSYACVLCELAVGYPLFPGENETEQLACIWETLGVPPKYLLDSSPRRANFFDETADATFEPKLVPNSRRKIRFPGTRPLHTFLGLPESDPFVDFIQHFLRWDPDERPAPEPAMRHPWICDAYVGVTPRMPVTSRRRDQQALESTTTSTTTAHGASMHHAGSIRNAPRPPADQNQNGSTAVPALPLITPRTLANRGRNP